MRSLQKANRTLALPLRWARFSPRFQLLHWTYRLGFCTRVSTIFLGLSTKAVLALYVQSHTARLSHAPSTLLTSGHVLFDTVTKQRTVHARRLLILKRVDMLEFRQCSHCECDNPSSFARATLTDSPKQRSELRQEKRPMAAVHQLILEEIQPS